MLSGYDMMQQEGTLLELVVKAVRAGAETMEVEYKNGYEEVFASRSGIGFGIARFRSTSSEGSALREELRKLTRKKHRIVIDDTQYDVRAHTYDSFGEVALRIQLRRI